MAIPGRSYRRRAIRIERTNETMQVPAWPQTLYSSDHGLIFVETSFDFWRDFIHNPAIDGEVGDYEAESLYLLCERLEQGFTLQECQYWCAKELTDRYNEADGEQVFMARDYFEAMTENLEWASK